MKLQLNANEKLTIVTPFGEIEISVDQFGATMMHQSDKLENTGSTGSAFENEKGERCFLRTELKDSGYKKYQIARPFDNDLNDPMDATIDKKYIFFLNESLNARSEKIPVEWFIEYCGIEDLEDLRCFDDYKLLEEYIFENHIEFNKSLDQSEDFYKVTEFK